RQNNKIEEIVHEVFKSQNLIYKNQNPLIHYTNGLGLNGILHSKTLRANHVSHLNDLSEILGAYHILVGILDNMSTKDPNILFLISELKDRLNEKINSKIFPEIYIVSFSNKEDDLFLWRSYSTFNDAYALVFTKAFLTAYAANDGAVLLQCVYDERKQFSILEQVTQLFFNKIDLSISENLQIYLDDYFKLIHLFVPYIKNSHFVEENEIRLVLKNPQNLYQENRIKLGLNKGFFHKYVNINMSRDEEDMEFEYSLQEIIIGPNSRSQIENNQFKNNLNKLIKENVGFLLKGIRDTKYNTLRF
ncbi:PF11185 family protein, partial [Leptospira santarosai str. CBC1416]